jgi:iron complex outermembrane receptor protein
VQKFVLSSLGVSSAVTVLVGQPAIAQNIPITGVELVPAAEGITLNLETPSSESLRRFQTQFGNTIVIDIINAQLRLPQQESFSASQPTANIAKIEVKQQYSNTVRITIQGTDQLPNVRIGEQGTRIAINPTKSPVAQEEPKTTVPSPTPSQSEPIELVVTATRTEENPRDIPRSVTVITREEIEEQASLDRDLSSILGNTLPGFGPPNALRGTLGQTLRGRTPSILIDGVPQNANSRFIRDELLGIEPNAIERIEVVRGPNAIYGGEATGGTINIITREPGDQPFQATSQLNFKTAFGNLDEESFGNTLLQRFSVNEDNVSLLLNASREMTGQFFDAEGDIIPGIGALSRSDTETFNILGKLGIDLGSDQQLQFTTNYLNDTVDTDIISDPSLNSVSGEPKAQALEVGKLDFIDASLPGKEQIVLNLDYTHDDLGGGQLKTQAFYRDSHSFSRPSDRRNDPRGFFGPQIIGRSTLESEKWGGRLQYNAPLSSATELLVGADWENESTSGPIEVFDGEIFDASGGQEFQKIDELTFRPFYKLSDLGLFAQLQWDVSDRWRISGGLRHERIGFNVDDYTAINGQQVEGGELDFNDTVFNVGTLYDISEEVSVYANFSQGFSVPAFSRILRLPNFSDIESGVDITQPQKVDSYELGIRGNFNNVDASLAAFYNFAELGTRTEEDPETGFLVLQRDATRIYGIEATLDWEMSDDFTVGGILSWNEGDRENDDGEFIPLSSLDIQPLKLTTYLEYQPTSNWSNRLQVLFVGGRDRAFEEDVDPLSLESYAVVDYIASFRMGNSTLKLGIENLLDNQYFPASAQILGGFRNENRIGGRGRTLSINYSLEW